MSACGPFHLSMRSYPLPYIYCFSFHVKFTNQISNIILGWRLDVWWARVHTIFNSRWVFVSLRSCEFGYCTVVVVRFGRCLGPWQRAYVQSIGIRIRVWKNLPICMLYCLGIVSLLITFLIFITICFVWMLKFISIAMKFRKRYLHTLSVNWSVYSIWCRCVHRRWHANRKICVQIAHISYIVFRKYNFLCYVSHNRENVCLVGISDVSVCVCVYVSTVLRSAIVDRSVESETNLCIVINHAVHAIAINKKWALRVSKTNLMAWL